MRFFKSPCPLAPALPVFLLTVFACAVEDGTMTAGKPAYAFSRQWITIERAALSENFEAERAGVLTMLGDFRSSLGNYFEAPLYKIYRFDLGLREETIGKVFELSGTFEEAVRAGRGEALPVLALDIQEALTLWLARDAEIADSIHLTYFYQFFIFGAVISLLALAVWRLGRALSRSRIREEQSSAFSKVMVLAQEAERGRISRELHDSVAQELRYQALRVAKIDRTGDQKERSLLCAEVISAQEALTGRIRAICDGLFPADFRGQGLPNALRRFCGDFGKRTGIDCRLSIQEDVSLQNILASLDAGAQLHCFRLIQESLTNIEKHAGAAEAVVVVRAGDADTLQICVNDDGKGFAIPPSPEAPEIHDAEHYGIRGMYARIAILRGTLTFESESGEGTAVMMTIPKQTAP
ncbi:MAG: histidine kinase [Spirochaetaceae bacterium]|jgi:signal transduction histidine kinase|nr:histidine kinase [Spirochaetaceae bacterium]